MTAVPRERLEKTLAVSPENKGSIRNGSAAGFHFLLCVVCWNEQFRKVS